MVDIITNQSELFIIKIKKKRRPYNKIDSHFSIKKMRQFIFLAYCLIFWLILSRLVVCSIYIFKLYFIVIQTLRISHL